MLTRGFFFKVTVSFLALFTLNNFSLANKTIYVDDDAVGTNNGSSWQNAYIYLQDALADANSSEKPVEIRIAQGTYKPDQGAGQTTGDREATFMLIDDITLSGGYAGILGVDPNEQDYEKYETVLSGDLADDDANTIEYPRQEYTQKDNSYNVIINSGVAFIDGLIISSGCGTIITSYEPRFQATINEKTYGAGILNSDTGNLTITNCTFSNNSADIGGGMYNYSGMLNISDCVFVNNFANENGGGFYNDSGTFDVKNCTFKNNFAYFYGGGFHNLYGIINLNSCNFTGNKSVYFGGGVCNGTSWPYGTNYEIYFIDCNFTGNTADSGGAIYNGPYDLNLINCTFIENKAPGGGGLFSRNGNLFVNNCIFSGNTADTGGGLSSQTTLGDLGNVIPNYTLSINNCLFSGNHTIHEGGAIYNFSVNSVITNCTFTQNRAKNGNTLALNSYEDQDQSIIQLRNCILWNGSNEMFIDDSPIIPKIDISFSNIQGGWEGMGNINNDPAFVDSGYWDTNDTPKDVNDDFWIDGDYHLKSQAGRWNSDSQTWLQDDATSPCIDTGDPNTPIGLEPFPNGGYINMGAYGGTAEASKSYFGKPVCETIVAGDINGDCRVDELDMAIMMIHWLEEH